MSSRIGKSLKNAQVNVLFYILTTILAFFSRKYFLLNLGDNFVGLSGTLGDMLNLLNITELGIGTAVSVTLYKPLFDNDRNKINDIISVFGFLYTRVGAFIGFIGLVISCFFPIIFRDAGVPLYLPYLMFYAMLYAALLGYFVNFRQIILAASQQNYVVMLQYNTAVISKVILQIATSFLPYNYLWWIALEAISITAFTFLINRSIRKRFPWLQASHKEGREKFREYKGLWTKTKQVFCFKVSHLVLNSSTNMLIYAFANLSTVALYGNYNMVMCKITAFVDGIFTGMGASIGNLIAEGNMEKTLKVFNELLSIRYYLAGLCSISLYFISSPLIAIWLGEQYIMGNHIILLLSLHIFIQQARLTVTNFKDGYGFFEDVWAPIAEVILNLGMAILLGYFMGLSGILAALILSQGLIKMVWQPYYLFAHGFRQSVLRHYWPLILKYACILVLVILVAIPINNFCVALLEGASWYSLLGYCMVMGCWIFAILTLLFYMLDADFRLFIGHMLQYIKHRHE